MSASKVCYVASVSMVTPVGGDAKTTLAATKAGVNRYIESSFTNKNSSPMKMAVVPDDSLPELDDAIGENSDISDRDKKILQLASKALTDLYSTFKIEDKLPIFFAGPEPIKSTTFGTNYAFLDCLATQSNVACDRENSRMVLAGRAGGIMALELAFRYLSISGKKYAIVGGADSFADEKLLKDLDEDDRVLADGVMNGFAPGEGASFLLLTTEERPTFSKVFVPGLAEEVGHLYSDQTYTGDGLANAFKSALANAGAAKIEKIYASLNGENFGSKEYGVAYMRTSKHFSPDMEIVHPADCYGDLGAATAPVLIGLASSSAGANLVYCSSDLAQRGAVCVDSRK